MTEPLGPPRPARRFGSRATAELGSLEPDLPEHVGQELVRYLLVEGPRAEWVNVVVLVVVLALVWSTTAAGALLGWGVVVLAATVTRELVRRRLVTRGWPATTALRRARLVMAAAGLAWGVGVAVFVPLVPPLDAGLLLMVDAGLAAAAVVTLSADPWSFRFFLAGLLTPLPVALVQNVTPAAGAKAVLLVALFGAAMVLLHKRANALLMEHLRQSVRARTDARQALRDRAYLDALLAGAPVAMAIVDADHRVVGVNAQFEALFGYPAAEILERDMNDLIVPPGARTAAQELEARAAAGERVQAEVERRHRDGHLVPVGVSAAAVGDAGGDVFVLYEDITARRRGEAERAAAAEALREARDAAQRLAQTRSAFLANMSHEIRTPMNAILGLTELLLDTDLTVEQRHSLSLVQVSGQTLLTLINDILDFSKIEAEHLTLESTPFDLPHLIESTVALLAVRARERRLELLADTAPEVPRFVRGDPTRLRQVLTNLVGNALKFTPAGEVVLSARLASRAERGPLVRFAVRDTGIGIDPAKRQAIFAEFGQADVSTTRKYGGTGLGLAISSRLVRLMGGELDVESEVGRGSEFRFTLPFEAEAAPVPAASRLDTALVGRRALIVDDNATNRRIVRDMLRATGMRVEEAEDGAAGLAAIQRASTEQVPYDLAIIDAHMPELDGFGLAAAVGQAGLLARTRLLMLTSAGQRGDGQRCRELGIGAYLTKPAARGDLLEAMGTLLGAPAAPQPGAAAARVITRHTIAESRPQRHILLAEDNPVNQEVAGSMLRRRGHTVEVVADGRAAVTAVERRRYDVVLMDIQMPEMDGYEATAAIRALPGGKALSIIALTAHALSGEREKCLAIGMSGYLTKPFRAEDLFAAVEGAEETSPTPGPADLEAFRRDMRAAGAEDAVDAILQTFLDHAAERTGALLDALAAGEPPRIERAAHAFKSAAAAIGAKPLADLLQEIESAGHAAAVDAARELAVRFRTESDALTRHLRDDLDGRKS